MAQSSCFLLKCVGDFDFTNSDRETILFVLLTTPVLHVALLIPTPVYIHNQSLIIIKIIDYHLKKTEKNPETIEQSFNTIAL